jgi:hypothetical protein
MAQSHGSKLVHTVYFSLTDKSAQVCDQFIEICQHFLIGHPGQSNFLIGPRNHKIDRNVSDLNFDVAMTMVFDTFEDYEAYQTSARHDEFVEKISGMPHTVRVFDSYLV